MKISHYQNSNFPRPKICRSVTDFEKPPKQNKNKKNQENFWQSEKLNFENLKTCE